MGAHLNSVRIFLGLRAYQFLESSKTTASNEPRRGKTVFFAYAKTKTQISFAVTSKLISAFVFAT